MEINKSCLKFKEMIMEKIDAEADVNSLSLIEAHTHICAECAEYEKTLINMTKLTSTLKVEAPEFLETRVMAAINSAVPSKSFNFKPVLSFGVTFVLLFSAVFVLLYNNNNIHPLKTEAQVKPAKSTVQVAQIPVIKISHPFVVKQPVKALEKSVATTSKAEVAVVIPEKTTATAPVLGVEVAAVSAAQKVPEKGNSSVLYSSSGANSNPAVNVNTNYGVSSVNAAEVSSAKVTPVPTDPGIPLLDSDKAIVGNNMINTNRGEAAHIMIKVEQTARVRIIIYDKAVRPVANILDEEKTPGNYDTYWYGKTDNNQTVSGGVYFVYIQIGKRVIKKNIIVTK
jgi:hypothetical protein